MPGKLTMGPIGFFGLALGMITIVIAAFYIGHKTPKQINQLEEYNKTFVAYQDSVVKPLLAYTDSIKNVASVAKKESIQLEKISNSRTIQINKLQQSLSILQADNKALIDSVLYDTVSTCDQCIRAVKVLTEEVSAQKAIIATFESRDSLRLRTIALLTISNQLQEARGDSLYKIVINIPVPKPQSKFLNISIPNVPKKYLVGGSFILGFIAAK